VLLVGTGCPRPSQDQEGDALNTRSAAIQNRAAAAAADLEQLASEVTEWREQYQMSASTGDILASLLAHPLGLHIRRDQTELVAQAYSRLEEGVAGFKAEQRSIEAAWSALRADVDDWAERHSITFEEFTLENQFTVGEPLPSQPGAVFRRKPCSQTVKNAAGRTCHLVEEHCIYIGTQGGHVLWSQLCRYRCSRSLNPFNKPGPSTIAAADFLGSPFERAFKLGG